VDPSLPVRDIKSFIQHTRSNPKKAAIGHMPGAAYLGALRFRVSTGADAELIPYKGQPQIWTDLLGGRLWGGIEPVGGVLPQIRAGKLRAIALLGAKRTALLPDVATSGEQGFPGLEADAWNALFARKQGMEVETSDPKALGQRVREDRAKWAKAIKDFNVKAED
jgi:tripartite-type tricarboxylate transporter receptor subunit TctC